LECLHRSNEERETRERERERERDKGERQRERDKGERLRERQREWRRRRRGVRLIKEHDLDILWREIESIVDKEHIHLRGRVQETEVDERRRSRGREKRSAESVK
jgi:hypothetical protein